MKSILLSISHRSINACKDQNSKAQPLSHQLEFNLRAHITFFVVATLKLQMAAAVKQKAIQSNLVFLIRDNESI